MKNKILISTLVFIVFCIISLSVFASSFNIATEVENQTDDTITLLLKIADVKFNNSISAIEGNIEYDENIFEEIKLENLNDWSIVYNNDGKVKGKFAGFKISDEEIKQEELCKITFKLKQGIENKSTQILIKNIKSVDGDNLVSTEDKTIDIDIKDSIITNTKEEKNPISNKSLIKYIFILVIVLLTITVLTSVTYLIQKNKYERQYSKIVKNKKSDLNK